MTEQCPLCGDEYTESHTFGWADNPEDEELTDFRLRNDYTSCRTETRISGNKIITVYVHE